MKTSDIGGMMKRSTIVAPFVALLLLAGVSGAATIISGGTLAHITGVGGRVIDVDIDYIVEDLATYPGGQLPGGSNGSYVYEYTLHNLGTSNVKIDLFSVAAELNASIMNIGTYGSPPAVNALTEITDLTPGVNQSAKFSFVKFDQLGLTPLGIDQYSYKLIFTSDYYPGMGYAFVSGGSIGGEIANIPVPVPEPVSAVLLAIGGLAFFRKRLTY